MTENTTTETVESTEPIAYEKGSWQEALQKSSNLLDRSAKARKTASNLLWKGAKEGIEGWLPESATDVSGERLYGDVIEALGKGRKGDASKIKTVAVAVRTHGLDLSVYPNLSKAYAEATRLTKTVAVQAEEDDAAEKAIESIEAPKTTGSVEGAAALLLSKGVDGAVVAILDTLGAKNEAAHRAFMRAVSTEIAARVQANKPKPAPKAPAAPKAGATASTGKAGVKKATAPVASKTKGKPVKGTASKPAAPVAEDTDKGEPITDPVDAGTAEVEDIFDEIEAEDTAAEAPAPVAKKKAGRPVVRRPQR